MVVNETAKRACKIGSDFNAGLRCIFWCVI